MKGVSTYGIKLVTSVSGIVRSTPDIYTILTSCGWKRIRTSLESRGSNSAALIIKFNTRYVQRYLDISISSNIVHHPGRGTISMLTGLYLLVN